jgi:ParB/RepB/Spo0J family partition protein
MMGGHLRLEAASELCIEDVSAIICDYDQLALAKGTYYENNGRQRLTPIEEGRIFEQCMKDRSWTQEEVAEHLVVPGGRKYISFCITAANADADVQEVLRREPGRGRRCFSYLLRLDELGREKAMKLRQPIIEDFLAGKISTDAVELRVSRILERERNSEAQEGADESKETIEDIKLQSKILTAQRSIDGLEKKIGVSAPSQSVRESLLKLKEKIEAILGR